MLIKTIVKGIQIARKIAQFDPLKSHITEEYQPGSEVKFDDYESTLDWAWQTSVTIYHPTGTCKMGNDKMAVVDERLRVYGVRPKSGRLFNNACNNIRQYKRTSNYDW